MQKALVVVFVFSEHIRASFAVPFVILRCSGGTCACIASVCIANTWRIGTLYNYPVSVSIDSQVARPLTHSRATVSSNIQQVSIPKFVADSSADS